MPLPDISRVQSLPRETLRAFGARLKAIGLSLDRVAPILRAVQPIPPALRGPMRKYHLRAIHDPVGFAMRALVFHDPVTREQVREALGDLVDPLLEAGLLVSRGEGEVVSPFTLSIVEDLFVLSDDLAHGEDAVMGLGETTVTLCHAALPDRPVKRALDLGCGAGTAALVLSWRAQEVVATDINPRAIALSRVNAAVNGITNIDFREGSLFEPVKGETFDRIASQPPFVPRPEGAAESAFLYGGRRGDELSLELLSGVARHLSSGGRAVLLIEWPETGADTIEARIQSAVSAQDLDLLLLRAPLTNPDEHATAYASGVFPLLDAEFEREALRRREHFARVGIQGTYPTITVLERRDSQPRRPGFTHTVPIAKLSAIRVTSARIDQLMVARSLAGKADRLLATTARMPEGTVLWEEQAGPGAEQPSSLHARFAEPALIEPIVLDRDLLFLLTNVHEAKTVREGLAAFAEAHEIPLEAVQPKLLVAVERALLSGVLELA
jgi:SAM-dependent methyltransferase